jgi:hypothetical protein
MQTYSKAAPALTAAKDGISFEDAESVDRVAFLTTVAIFILTYLVFSISPIGSLSDSMYSLALSESILHDHSAHLDQYQFPQPVAVIQTSSPPMGDPSFPLTYQLGNLHGHIVYVFPNGGSILSLPFVAFMNATGFRVAPGHKYSLANEMTIQRALAALLMAIVTCLVFRTSLLLLTTAPSMIIALGFAFGTQVWSTGTRALWSHTWLIFLGALAAYHIMAVELGRQTPRPMLFATILAWMYFVRPTGAISIACCAVYVFACHRSSFIRFAITGAVWLVGFIGYWWMTFGELIPGYYRSRFTLDHFATGLYANLLSPARGLFTYVPILGFVLYLVVAYRRSLPLRRVAILSITIATIQLIAAAAYPCWWGGFNYGARLTMDSLPWFVVLAILGCRAATVAPGSFLSRRELAAALALLALSVAINGRGAFAIKTEQWSTVVDVNKHPERVFDWSYPQFAAGLVSPPDYVIENIRRIKRASAAAAPQLK